MEQLQALKELASRIENGSMPVGYGADTFTERHGETGLETNWGLMFDAYNGSLDAAHSLHKAVLGDRWTWQVQDYGSPYAYVTNRERPEGDRVRGGSTTAPARAWLLAIIKAKIAELETEGE